MGQSEWNAGTSSVGDVWSNLGTVAGELKWPIFGLYVVGFLLVCIAISVVFAASQPVAGLLLSGEDVNWLLLAVGWGGAWLISGTVFFGLLGTGRRALLEGDRPGGLFATCGDFLRRSPTVFVAVLLVSIAQCMVICLPGLVFGALSPVAYLAATRDDMSITDAFWEGVGWLKRHIVTLGVSYALSSMIEDAVAGVYLLRDPDFMPGDRIDVGGLHVNSNSTFRVDHMPYGGIKASGFGREGVKYAMEEMTDLRLMVVNLA